VADRPVRHGAEVLATRIGRRFVLTFAFCALVPLIVFTLVGANRVSEQMRKDMLATLHNGAKTAGMGMAARLSQVAGDLALCGEWVESWQHGIGSPDAAVLEQQVGERLAGVWFVDGAHVHRLCGAGDLPTLSLGPEQDEHLARGNVLVRAVGDPAELLLVRDLSPGKSKARVAARVRKQWFWDPQELRSPNCEFVAIDASGRLLFHTFPEAPPLARFVAAAGLQPSSGTVEWSPGAVPHVARYWRAFLRPRYDCDFVLVQSRPSREALAVVDSFVRWFWLTAACTLLVVLLTSMGQIRNTLEPIFSLRDATRRIGDGDLSVRVDIERHDEFGDLGRAFNDMASRLQETTRRREQTERELVASRDAALAAVKAKAEFVTNVSHEFRTPMAEILGAAEILTQLSEDDASARVEFSQIALHGAQRLAALVEDVLALGEAASGPRVATGVAATLHCAATGMPPAIRARIDVDVPDDLPPVLGDAGRLTETWCRLLDNAAKFSPPATRIGLKARAAGGEVVVEVRDEGIGIAPEDQERIFTPFCQVGRDQLVDKAHGAGLGLTLARSVVEDCGGRISVESRPGKGTTFRIVLPTAQRARAQETADAMG
jgi:signal transduction histidine kinase